MAEIVRQGRVIEARPDLLVIREGGMTQETTLYVDPPEGADPFKLKPGFAAEPGNYVFIYDDGTVEAKGVDVRAPSEGEPVTLPTEPPQQDHGEP